MKEIFISDIEWADYKDNYWNKSSEKLRKVIRWIRKERLNRFCYSYNRRGLFVR